MLGTLLKGIFHRPTAAPPPVPGVPMRLHIGGVAAHPDWKILNAQAGPGVDFVGDCRNLSFLGDASVAEVYASHVLEHLGYWRELPAALGEIHRVLAPGGLLRISVPDIEVLGGWITDAALSLEEHFLVMRMMFGGQIDAFDFHKVGLSWRILEDFLRKQGFTAIERVERFGLFKDTSDACFRGCLVSLNVSARKPA